MVSFIAEMFVGLFECVIHIHNQGRIVNWYFAVFQEGSEILLLVYAVLQAILSNLGSEETNPDVKIRISPRL